MSLFVIEDTIRIGPRQSHCNVISLVLSQLCKTSKLKWLTKRKREGLIRRFFLFFHLFNLVPFLMLVEGTFSRLSGSQTAPQDAALFYLNLYLLDHRWWFLNRKPSLKALFWQCNMTDSEKKNQNQTRSEYSRHLRFDVCLCLTACMHSNGTVVSVMSACDGYQWLWAVRWDLQDRAL